MRERKPQATTENGVQATYRREAQACLISTGRWGSVPHPAIGGYLVSIDCKPKVDGQESGANPEASKGGNMIDLSAVYEQSLAADVLTQAHPSRTIGK